MNVARPSTTALALVLVGVVGAACNAFRSTEDCQVSTDCPRGTTCATPGNYCRSGGPIPIGAVLPLTGTQEGLGKVRHQGLRFGLWLLERDPSQRVLGRGLELTVEDSASTSANIPRLTASLIARNIAALFGPLSSPEVLEAQKATFPIQLLHIGPGVGASVLGEAQGPLAGRFLFQLSTSIRHGTIRALPLFLVDPKHPATYDVCFDGVAVIVNEDATGDSYEKALGDLIPQNCIPVTRSLRVPVDKKGSYGTEVAALLSAENGGKPTRCLFMSVFPPVAGEILRLLAASTPSTRARYTAVFGSSILNTNALFDAAKSAVAGQPSLAEGLHGVDFDTNPPRAAFRDLAELWQEFAATDPELEGLALTADRAGWAEAVVTVGLALELAGTASDPVRLRDAYLDLMQPDLDDTVIGPKEIGFAINRIRDARKDGRKVELDYRGAISDYDFDEQGFIDTPAFVWRANKGAIERAVGYEPADLVRAWAEPGAACARK